MASLKPAGFLARLGTFFFPKHVIAQVRTETLENGQVQITPYFTIDGEEVPADLIALDKRQSILGYNVVLDEHSENVLRQTQGKPTRLAKRRAGEFLSQLDKSGIRSKDGKIQPRVEKVKPDVSLRLTPDDTLEVQSELCTADGIVFDKPANLDQLRQEDGWFSVGDDLLRVDASNTPLDDILIGEGGNRTLADEDVPKFLKSLDQQSQHIGEVEKNDALKPLSVFSGEPEYRARVDGTADSITISPSLVFRGAEGRQYEQTSEDVQRFEQHGGGFRRVTEGWVEVSPEDIAAFHDACDCIGSA